MPHYKCNTCNFGTYRLHDILRHEKSKKHLKNILYDKNLDMMDKILYDVSDNDDYISESSCDYSHKNQHAQINYSESELKTKLYVATRGENKCEYCGHVFSCYQNLWRHKRNNCQNYDHKPKKIQKKKIKNKSNDDSVKLLMNELKEQREEMKEQKKEMIEMKEQNKKLLDLATKNADVSMITAKSTNKSMNMMSHAMKHWANAPPMKQLEGKDALKLITYENKSKRPIEEVIIYQFNAGTLDRFLGNVLIKEFKKEDEVDQSLWTTDSSRLCFIIKQIVGNGENDKWIADKSGIEITKLLIAPLTDKVSEMMTNYSKKFFEIIKENINDAKKAKDAMNEMHHADLVLLGIVQNNLRKEILKYIAPYFNIDVKNQNLQKV